MFNLRAQNSIQDLKDSVRVKEFISSAAKLAEKPDSQLFFAKKAMELSIKINWSKGLAGAYYQRAFAYYGLTQLEKSLENYLLSANSWDQSIKNETDRVVINFSKSRRANVYGNIAMVYNDLANPTKSLEYNLKALKDYEELKQKSGVARITGNVGLTYLNEKDYKKAEECLLKAIQLDSELKNNEGLARHYSNIGNLYADIGKRKRAIDSYSFAQVIAAENGDSSIVATSLGNLGTVYSDIGDSCLNAGNEKKANEYYYMALEKSQQALNISLKFNDLMTCATWYVEIGGDYSKLKKFAESEKNLLRALQIAEENGYSDLLDECWGNLSALYSTMGQYEKAYNFHVKYIAFRDSVYNKENTKKIIQSQLQYDYERKQTLAKAEQDKKDVLNDAEKKKQSIITISVSVGLILMFIIIVIISRSLKQNKQKNKIITEQKHEVEKQKELVEDKQKEILDSINYAQRIQKAILAREEEIKHHLKNSFLFYRPKDIIAGDFYFFEVTDTYIFYAAADCTGHGVPGALMSVVCSNSLSRSVKEFGLVKPGEILDKTRELVVETLRKSGEEVKDGMDISLLCISRNNLSNIQWSGANNPLWYINNNNLVEIKADKQPIGLADNKKPFTSHSLNLSKDDVLFLFTDGYADQFGGPKAKKFKYKQFQELLLANSSKSMNEQLDILTHSFEKWKGSLEQVDDVCVVGIRI
ncbi:MAG: tetratricopeptide repeat protein [Sphingobacteriaceae bacterium]|nr:tetratricopeptide repeat protein [Sphingobacteriaceae bacterium]